MTHTTSPAVDPLLAVPTPGRRWRRVTLGEVVAVVFAVSLVVASVAPGFLAPQNPAAVAPLDSFQPPSLAHPFGTDESGRDVYTRIVHGAGSSLLIGLAATGIGLATALLLALVAVFGGRFADAVVGRTVEVLFAFPALLSALLVILVLGPGPVAATVAVGLSTAPGYARIIRTSLLRVRASGYVESARLLGHSPARIVLRTILPNALSPLLALATLGVGQAVVWASSLSFLGLGAQPPAPEWGAMLASARVYLTTAWWLTVFPGLLILATTLATTTIGRSLDARSAGWGQSGPSGQSGQSGQSGRPS
ncbi:ABC transporter permease [Labedella populi]|uniref:ABC transporter permease n=1 Tax=Labedella populi TaxID=2498850 RepID=A0A3S3ZK10_9MICO|nr:ABC transporter permease [Labedella populi]RWZ61212.1 ABC transporter permease [Labedella populi]